MTQHTELNVVPYSIIYNNDAQCSDTDKASGIVPFWMQQVGMTTARLGFSEAKFPTFSL
jgi:hypothetical protein